ncbi:MAG: peptidylprolyl isomerase [Rubrobacter sp.]|nr:peptidylprolyl isomerase [Rubrobacter sp.]
MSEHFVRKAWFVAGVLSIALLVLAGCDAAQTDANVESGAKKVAVFRGGEITEAEVQEQVKLLAQQSGMGEVSPDSPQYDAMLQQAMPQIVALEVAQAYAKEQGITVSEKEVDQEIEKIKDQVAMQAPEGLGREEAFDQALKQNKLTEEQLRQDIRENLPLQKVQERVAGGAKPSDQDVQDYYKQNKGSQFTNPAQRCARHILFNKDQKEKAEEVKTQLQDGDEFGPLSKKYSQDPGSAEKGGDLGCQPKVDPSTGQPPYVPAFNEAIWGADKGEILGPVETQFGLHLIEVTDVKEESVTPLPEVEGQIRQQLTSEKQSAAFQKWVEKEIEDRNVKYLNGYKPPKTPAGQPSSGSASSSASSQPSGE